MNKVMGNKKTIALFVLPAFIIYAIFALAPIFYNVYLSCLLYTSPSPRDGATSRMPSSA